MSSCHDRVMKVKEIRALVKEFKQSLDNKDKDEWWGTDRDIWDSISKKFLNWCERNRKKIESLPEKTNLAG